MTEHHATSHLSPDTPPGDLLTAVLELSGNVVTLTDRLSVSDAVTRRSRLLTFSVVILLTLGLMTGAYFQWQLSRAVSGNQTNAEQSCRNANDSRAASLSLWTTVLGYVQDANPEPNPDLVSLQSWISVLYRPHDCDDLGRVYKIPPAPVLGHAS